MFPRTIHHDLGDAAWRLPAVDSLPLAFNATPVSDVVQLEPNDQHAFISLGP